MRALSFIIMCVLLAGCAVRGDQPSRVARPDAEAEVRAIEQKWVDAEIRRDAAAVADLLDDQFLFVFGSNPPINKEQFVQAVPAFTSTSQVLSDQIVRIAGDTAFVTGRDTVEGTGRDGKHYTQRWRYTATYVFREGAWRALVEHMVPEAAPSP
jgi:uncharacterized protein (TIGR02246 family)